MYSWSETPSGHKSSICGQHYTPHVNPSGFFGLSTQSGTLIRLRGRLYIHMVPRIAAQIREACRSWISGSRKRFYLLCEAWRCQLSPESRVHPPKGWSWGSKCWVYVQKSRSGWTRRMPIRPQAQFHENCPFGRTISSRFLQSPSRSLCRQWF